MDLTLPGLLSGLLLGSLAMALMMYGRRETKPGPMLAGLIIAVEPFVIASLAWQWVVCAACLGLLYAASRAW